MRNRDGDGLDGPSKTIFHKVDRCRVMCMISRGKVSSDFVTPDRQPDTCIVLKEREGKV